MLQRIALPAAAAIGLLVFSGCKAPQQTAPHLMTPVRPPPGRVQQPPRRPLRNIPPWQRKPTIYPPLEPLPPRPQPAPAPPPRVQTPPPTSGRTYITRGEVIPRGGLRRNRWQAIVVHHSATDRDSPQSIDKYHREGRGWANGMGYHFVIGNGVNFPDGKIFVGPRWKAQQDGAHCRTSAAGSFLGKWRPKNFFNTNGIGICLIGDFVKKSPTPRQLEALEQLIALLARETGIAPAQVAGHGEITGKTECPGRGFSISRLRQRVLASREPHWVPYASGG